jgi:hypothetical protein
MANSADGGNKQFMFFFFFFVFEMISTDAGLPISIKPVSWNNPFFQMAKVSTLMQMSPRNAISTQQSTSQSRFPLMQE